MSKMLHSIGIYSMSYKLKNLRVLVVDDNKPIRALLRALLLDLGFGTIDAAETLEEGWGFYCEHKPDLILVDWRMDRQDAIEFTKRVREDQRSPAPYLPVIVMTGFTSKERVFHARDAGATEFLIKPFTIRTLVDHLTHIIERPRDFVIAPEFVGPDRRRRSEDVPHKKRRADKIKNADMVTD